MNKNKCSKHLSLLPKLSKLAIACGLSLLASHSSYALVAAPEKAALPTDDWLHVEGNKIVDAQGNQVWLTGANWFGFNTSERVFHGLWSVNLDTTVKAITERGINILRVPISTELLWEWSQGKAETTTIVNTHANPELKDMNTLQVFDAFLAVSKKYGLKVLLDVHGAEADNSGHIPPMWYKNDITSDMFYETWEWVAERYKNDDTLIAFDLENEPHGNAARDELFAKWDNSTDETNWKHACETASNRILDINPNMLIMCEGIQSFPKDGVTWTSKNDDDYHNGWWGGNLRGVKDFPIDLGERQRQFMYSPHDYGPTVFLQPWFEKDFDKDSLYQDVWKDNWMYIHEENIAPLLLGEWGGFMDGGDNEKWLFAIRELIIEHGLHHTFWGINPNSGDTGGLLDHDWTTWDEERYALLEPSLWKNDAGKYISLDHQVPLGGISSGAGISLGDHYNGTTPPPLDSDGDGVSDELDNCPEMANSGQWDRDKDGIGDACDEDIDGDFILNEDDNCPAFSNAAQSDQDLDGIGDACDEHFEKCNDAWTPQNESFVGTPECYVAKDSDGDEVPDYQDNCPLIANTGQWDHDHDGIGNVCDDDYIDFQCYSKGEPVPAVWPPINIVMCPDTDGDGIDDKKDNCVDIANPGQWDKDNDRIGNACDLDIDGDGCANDIEDALGTKKWLAESVPQDCTMPTGLDTDLDGVFDTVDNCVTIANPGQWDKDQDGIGNECDTDLDGDGCPNDIEDALGTKKWNEKSTPLNCVMPVGGDVDGDGVVDSADNCPEIANSGQWDKDEDGLGNECDDDIDGDGFSNQLEIDFGSKPWDKESVPEIATIQPVDQFNMSIASIKNGSLVSNAPKKESFSLYVFDTDLDKEGSQCNNGCADTWPPLLLDDAFVIEDDNFSTIVRTDGSKQVTYKSRPLYYFAGDTKAGDTKGDSLGGVWWLAK